MIEMCCSYLGRKQVYIFSKWIDNSSKWHLENFVCVCVCERERETEPVACQILVSQLGIKPMPTALGMPSLKQQTTREVP